MNESEPIIEPTPEPWIPDPHSAVGAYVDASSYIAYIGIPEYEHGYVQSPAYGSANSGVCACCGRPL